MAWSWSHTHEAYDNARTNLENLSKEKLEVIFAEWRAAQGKGGIVDNVNPQFSQKKYDRALAYAKTLYHDTLVEFIWEKMSEWATCENGGFDAHSCPFGCGCHTVSFDPPEDESLLEAD